MLVNILRGWYLSEFIVTNVESLFWMKMNEIDLALWNYLFVSAFCICLVSLDSFFFSLCPSVHFYYSIFVCLPMFVSVYPCLSVPVCLSIHLSLTLSLLFPSFNLLPYSFSSLFSPLSLLSLRFSLSIFLPLCLFFKNLPPFLSYTLFTSVSPVFILSLCFSFLLFSPLNLLSLSLSSLIYLPLPFSPTFSLPLFLPLFSLSLRFIPIQWMSLSS